MRRPKEGLGWRTAAAGTPNSLEIYMVCTHAEPSPTLSVTRQEEEVAVKAAGAA